MRSFVFAMLSFASILMAAPPSTLVTADLLADVDTFQPGTPFRVALHLTITPGWHIYWLNPGDGGMATRATLELPAGWAATPFEYPVPKAFDLPGGLTAYGYEDQATLIATVTPPNDPNLSNAIACKTSWMVCKDICVAGKAAPRLTLSRGHGDSSSQPIFSQAVAALPLQAGSADDIGEISDDFEMNSDGQSGKLAVVVRWKHALPDQIAFFPPPVDGINFAKPTVNSKPDQTTITTSFDLLAGQKPPAVSVDSVLSWQLNHQTVGVKVPIHFESHVQTVK